MTTSRADLNLILDAAVKEGLYDLSNDAKPSHIAVFAAAALLIERRLDAIDDRLVDIADRPGV